MARPSRLPAASAAFLAALAALVGGGCSAGSDDDGGGVPPQIGIEANADVVELGFPVTATRNTTRVGGGDPIADVAGVAAAVWPATSETTRPPAVILVDKDDWQGGIAASVLVGSPVGAPILLSDGDDIPGVTQGTIDRLAPAGSDLTDDAQVIRIGDTPPEPDDLKTTTIEGADEYELAGAIDRFHAVARGEPSGSVILASGERAEYAMPAAAMAARSGDPVLFTTQAELPEATKQALERHEKPNVFILGPTGVIGEEVERQLRPLARNVERIQGPTPVQNAIEFARYSERGFGWGIETPGHNVTIASTSRPIDAVGAASLATNGVFAPLLLTDDPATLPRSLESYLLDIQPGYEEDPSLSVFNHVWLLGDDDTISVEQQARIDEISALVPVEYGDP